MLSHVVHTDIIASMCQAEAAKQEPNPQNVLEILRHFMKSDRSLEEDPFYTVAYKATTAAAVKAAKEAALARAAAKAAAEAVAVEKAAAAAKKAAETAAALEAKNANLLAASLAAAAAANAKMATATVAPQHQVVTSSSTQVATTPNSAAISSTPFGSGGDSVAPGNLTIPAGVVGTVMSSQQPVIGVTTGGVASNACGSGGVPTGAVIAAPTVEEPPRK